MKITFNNAQKMNDIIFANRNKEYGAYALRSAYNATLIKVLSYVVSTVFLLSAGIYIANRNVKEKISVYVGTNDTTFTIPYDGTPPEPENKQPEPPTKKAPVAILSTELSTNISDTVRHEQNGVTNNNINPIGDPKGDPNANNLSGTGTETAVTNVVPDVIEQPTAFPVQEPEFEGGFNALRAFLASNIVYPELAKDAGVGGTVHVTFIINEKGEIESSKLLKGIGYGCDEEAVRVVNKIPKFKKPGKNAAGKPVKVIYNIPIAFKLK
ncbi:MAG TPA: TonB family protein [Bacteroidia bacterium]|nr:TonB family protein [Bacteroidia bacterium]